MSRNENKSATFLRTQSYIANGMTSPDFKSSKKDGFKNLVKNNYNKKESNKSKAKRSKSKNYINDVKKQKKENKTFFNKKSQKQLLKKYINDKLDEKTEIINNKNNTHSRNNAYIYNTRTEKFKNINENYLYSKTQHLKIKNGKEKVYSKGKENDKNSYNIRNKKKYNNNGSMISNHDYEKSNGFHRSSIYTNKSNDEYFKKTKIEKRDSKFDLANIVNQTKLGIMTTRAKMSRTRNKNFRKDIDSIYSMTYRSKIKANNSKVFTTLKKEKNFVNKILTKENDDYLDIKNHKNKNKLLNKLKQFTKREKTNFEDKSKIQRGLLTVKNLINKKVLNFSPKVTSINNNINTQKNIFHYSYSNYNQYNNNTLNKFKSKTKSKYKDYSPVLTEYNKNKIKNESATDLFKIKMSKSLSNIINSIRDERQTSKFIKDLNKNKKSGKEHLKFSFSQNKDDDLNDEFYSPNKNKIKMIQFKEAKKLSNNKKINYFIKKNISSDNFKIGSGNRKYKNNYIAINKKINNFINSYNERNLFVMPVNKAINE